VSLFLILVTVWLGSPMLVLAGLWIITRRVSRRTLEAPSIAVDEVRSAKAPRNERKAA
jgi:uncharacterized protein YneF (UPF0154 family)